MSQRKKLLLFLLPCILFALVFITVVVIDKVFPQTTNAQLIKKEEKDDSGRVTRTAYFSEDGSPAVTTGGYHAIEQQYNEAGSVSTIIYQGITGEPVKNTSGYSIRERTFNEKGQLDTEFYYDTSHQPVMITDGYHAVRRTYTEEGALASAEYLDISGNLTLTGSGYAVISRKYVNDKITEDYYFGVNREPVCCTGGYFGVRKEVNEAGQEIRKEYLDAEGQLMAGNNGVAIETEEYADGKRVRILYFDASGNPASIHRSYYGIGYKDGKIIHLNEDGEEMFRLDVILNSSPILVVIAGVLFLILCIFSKGRVSVVLLILYTGFILLMTIMYREPEELMFNLNPMEDFTRFFQNASARQEILNNIWLFIPFGLLLGKVFGRLRVALIPILFSLAIEIIQYVFHIGFSDICDVMNNSFGGFIGCLAGIGIRRLGTPGTGPDRIRLSPE